MTDKDKKNQNKPFLFDSKEMEKLVSYDPPIEQLRKEKKEVKKKIKEERKEVMRIATTPMQIPIPTLRQIPEQPFSSEEEILKAIISFYTIQNIHQLDGATYYYGTYSYVYDGTYSFRDSYPNYFLYPAKSFLNQIRVFFNSGSMFEKKEYSEEHSYYWNKKIDVKNLAYSYKQFYKDNKNSDSAVEKLTKDVITLLSFEELFIYLYELGLRIEEENWYEKYLENFFERFPEETRILQQFIIAAIYDSDLRFTVSNRKNKFKITWYIDQEFIGSDDNYERGDAVSVLFDSGLLMADLGEFHNKSAPKVIDRSLTWGVEYDEYMELDFIYCRNEKKVQKVCAAWEKGELGKATIKRGKKHISLDWDYPKSFRPYDLQLIRQNCRDRFSEVNEHEFYDHDINKDDEIFRMIINTLGW